ncbi:hypothetical protein LCGC14_1694070 [marine sediment metagenome]|uniref:Uncharacterized protein n=1 Tax=marine sediment metagenome TaxID=412755 RepID=A0A0F9KK10_9ZZZZ
MEITRRYRVNVGTSVKGVKSFDCTVEVTATDDIESQIYEYLQRVSLAESDALVAELDKRYPPPKGD